MDLGYQEAAFAGLVEGERILPLLTLCFGCPSYRWLPSPAELLIPFEIILIGT